jgi:DNA-binding winged helix-turn-helix (wHTH) protein/Tol biopolymer transport system component
MPRALYAFGPFHLDLASRRLMHQDAAVAVTVKAFDILAALVEHAGHVVDKDELMRRVWPDAIVEEANLSQQIFLLRKALGEGPKDHRFIATVPRRGYRFVAKVTEIHDTESSPGTTPDSDRAVSFEPPGHVLKLSLTLGLPLRLSPSRPFAISPDGLTLVYVAEDPGGGTLASRRLDSVQTVRLPRTEGAVSPFFSPDGRWIGFFANGKMRRIPAAGGAPIDICDAGAECRGASWSCQDEIVFAPTPAAGLVRVPVEGGRPRPATELDFASGERTHRWPGVLPDGRSVLFTIARAGSVSFEEAEIAVASLETGERRIVHRFGSSARYVRTGHLAYVRGGTLMAVPFDLGRLIVTGTSLPVGEDVMAQPTGVGYFCASEDGCLISLTGRAQDVVQRLVWIQNGALTSTGVEDRSLEEPRLAPDGSRIAFGRRQATSDIWIKNLETGALTRLTFEGDNFAPIWSRDGTRVIYSSNRLGPCSIFSQALDAAEPTLLVSGEHDLVPGCWTPDGRELLFTEYNPHSGAGIWRCDPQSQSAPTPLIRPRGNAFSPAISPDGCSVAYASDESGALEVWTASFPAAAGRRQITSGGASEPVWSRDGRLLYFRQGSGVFSSTMPKSPDGSAAEPVCVASGAFQTGSMTGLPNYDVGADGQLILVAQSSAMAHPTQLAVTVRWFGEILRQFA